MFFIHVDMQPVSETEDPPPPPTTTTTTTKIDTNMAKIGGLRQSLQYNLISVALKDQYVGCSDI